MSRYAIIIAVIILGCSSKPDQESVVKTADTLRVEVQNDSIHFEHKVLHHFSSLTTKDTFKINVIGSSFDHANVHFQIITKDNRIILGEVFPADSLLSSTNANSLSAEEKKVIVTTRILNFFNEPNFHKPAIQDSYTFDATHADKMIWDDLKSDRTSIGFSYTVGQQDSRFIGFSKKSKQVVLYYGPKK